MLAPVAMQQGEQAAKNLLAQVRQQPMRHFIYNDRGKMATIGRRAAVVDAFGIHLTGLLAWLGWLLVHLMELVGFRNRIIVLINWAYNYFTYDKGFRVIDRRECP
jgi:NADH dehydrogenase